jgi:hypothetical protein
MEVLIDFLVKQSESIIKPNDMDDIDFKLIISEIFEYRLIYAFYYKNFYNITCIEAFDLHVADLIIELNRYFNLHDIAKFIYNIKTKNKKIVKAYNRYCNKLKKDEPIDIRNIIINLIYLDLHLKFPELKFIKKFLVGFIFDQEFIYNSVKSSCV